MLLAWIMTVWLNTGETEVLAVYSNQLECDVHRQIAVNDPDVRAAECVEFWDNMLEFWQTKGSAQ
jgi:hypothetical protein